MSAEAMMLAVAAVLEQLGVPYMVVGSFSSNVYGIPRSTHDADFVVQFERVGVDAVMSALGSGYELDPQMSFETITATSRYRIRHRATAFTIEMFLLSDDPHDRERFARRRQMPVGGGVEAFVPSAEDVIIMKLRWSRQGQRTKDLDDVQGVIAVQRDALDWDYIHRWCDAHGTRLLLDKLRASLPPL